MSDRFPGEIWIGGRLSESLVLPLCQAICEERVALDWEYMPFEPKSAEDLLEARCELGGNLVLRLCDEETTVGSFYDLERFLIDKEIPFTRQSDGKYEFNPARIDFRPGHPLRELCTTQAHDPVVLVERISPVAAELANISRELAANNVEAAKWILKKAREQLRAALPMRLPALPTLEFVPDEQLKSAGELSSTARTVNISLEGGVVQHVDTPNDVQVVVCDYDAEGLPDESLQQDEQGNLCRITRWPPPK